VEITDAAAYLHIQLRARWRRRNRHPGTVEVSAVAEADIVVVDALVGRPERLALLERHVAPIALPRERERCDGHPPPHVVLQPGCWNAEGGQTAVRGRPDCGGDGGLLLRRVPRLDDASWSFFVLFSQDGTFMALALWEEVAGGVMRAALAQASL
jgi:hypothetical protein